MKQHRSWKLLAVVGVLALLAAACPGGGDEGGGLLSEIQERGTLNCGINGSVPGFGFVDEQGNESGFDVEYCQVVAAAILGDANAVEYSQLTAEQRFTALQAGEIDVLIRNTTWTATRDGSEGATFLTTTFYDGQGMMVPSDSDIQSIDDMSGAAVCVLSGTTTELNLSSLSEERGLDLQISSFEDNETLQSAFIQGQCDAWTSDKSQLAAIRGAWPDAEGGPEGLTFLDETISKEPLGPLVRDGQTALAGAVNWAVIATIQAEEFGIDSSNVDQIRDTTEDPDIQRFLGVQEDFDAGLDLPVDFAYQVISQVGNYAEIYERNVGPDTPLGLERGLNALWTEGGLLYPPPYR
ncbi:MAG: transporter substrate-binding domain-containing protein [Nitriliruptorales bacterium]